MTEPVSFTSTSARHALPFLFAGQSQKEFIVNEAFGRIDWLLHPAVEGTALTPPAAPLRGQAWLVGTGASGAFAAQDRAIAGWDGQKWHFAAPQPGMQVYDKSLAARLSFDGQWRRAVRPAAASGGTVVDVQARALIVTLLDSLQAAGVISAT